MYIYYFSRSSIRILFTREFCEVVCFKLLPNYTEVTDGLKFCIQTFYQDPEFNVDRDHPISTVSSYSNVTKTDNFWDNMSKTPILDRNLNAEGSSMADLNFHNAADLEINNVRRTYGVTDIDSRWPARQSEDNETSK